MAWLLDANVLIAMVDEEHFHHHFVETWIGATPQVATCPITEGALVRYLIRGGASNAAIHTTLAEWAQHPGHEFWPDDLPYAEADLRHVIGHRQVTDAYLISLARRHNAHLATLDEPLARLDPGTVTLIPTL